MQKQLGISLRALMIALAICTSVSCFAQSAATASVAVTIVTPGTVAKLSDLSINIPSSMLRACAPAMRSLQRSGRSHAASKKAEVSPASFEISGYANYTYGLTIPKMVTLTEGGYVIALTPRAGTTSEVHTLSALGSGTVSVGGSVAVSTANTVSAPAKSEALAVTIVYN